MDELIGSKQLAKYLGISVRTLDTLDKNGNLPAGFRIGHVRRWRAEDVKKWIGEKVTKPAIVDQQ
jgi:excisionase family DNA binding protein